MVILQNVLEEINAVLAMLIMGFHRLLILFDI